MSNMEEKIKSERIHDVEVYLKTGRYNGEKCDNEKRVIRHLAKKFTIEDSHFFDTAKGSRRRVLRARSDVERVLTECHNNSAHQGTRRTQDKISLHYYWPNLTNDVNDWVRRCPECQSSSNIAAMPPPLQSIKTDGRWEVLGMDLVALPQTSCGNRYLLTVTDLFTKYIFLRALQDKSAKSVSVAVLELFHTFGPPLRIITDQGREFVNKVNEELFSLFGVRHSVTSAYHLQSNGQAERTNQTVKQELAKYAPYEINCSSQSSTGFSPFFLMFMRQPKNADSVNEETVAVDALVSTITQPQTDVSFTPIAETVLLCNTTEVKVRGKAKSAQDKQAVHYDARKRKGKRLVTVNPGDQVMKRNARKDTRQGGRLEPSFTGPYTLKAITPGGQCTLENRSGLELATRYNVSLLKPYLAQTVEQLSSQSTAQSSANEGGTPAGLLQEQEAAVIQKPGSQNRDSYERQLVEFVLSSSAVKEHVETVIQGKEMSSFQAMFKKANKTWSERSAIRLQGFGPVEEDDNVFGITRMLGGYLCEVMHRPKEHDDIYYITDVLFSEAVIFAIQELGLTREEAENLFRNYIPRCED